MGGFAVQPSGGFSAHDATPPCCAAGRIQCPSGRGAPPGSPGQRHLLHRRGSLLRHGDICQGWPQQRRSRSITVKRLPLKHSVRHGWQLKPRSSPRGRQQPLHRQPPMRLLGLSSPNVKSGELAPVTTEPWARRCLLRRRVLRLESQLVPVPFGARGQCLCPKAQCPRSNLRVADHVAHLRRSSPMCLWWESSRVNMRCSNLGHFKFAHSRYRRTSESASQSAGDGDVLFGLLLWPCPTCAATRSYGLNRSKQTTIVFCSSGFANCSKTMTSVSWRTPTSTRRRSSTVL
jgi:hypothetical protein